MDVPFLTKLAEYGVIGAVVAILFFILWQIICWAKTFISCQAKEYSDAVKRLTEQHYSERALWLDTYQGLNRSLELHNLQSIEFRKQSEESHRYQKEEHEKQLEQMNVLTNSMKQVEQALGRINGYTKQ